MIRQLYEKSEQLSKIDLTLKTLRNVFDTFTYLFAVIGLMWVITHYGQVMKLLTK